MKCPRCGNAMRVMTTQGVDVDVCYDGCGGIWFDQFELKKLDEKHETDAAFLNDVAGHITKSVAPGQKISCPRCQKLPLMKHLFAPGSRIEVDDCPGCAGMWLDGGELAKIHDAYPTEDLRLAAKAKFVSDVFARSRLQRKG